MHKWNNLTARYAGLIPRFPSSLIEPKHIWNTTLRLIIQGKLGGSGYTTNVHIFILGSCHVQSFKTGQDYAYSALCFFFYAYMCLISSSNHAPFRI